MPLTYNHILVAVDGSKEAELAFKKSIGIAKRNNATVHLVMVIDVRSLPGNRVFDRAVMSRARQTAQDLMDRYKEKAQAAGVEKVNLIIEQGSPKYMIPREVAHRIEADLIVCGAAGLNRLERFMLGSVSQHIVRSSTCDVLVVRTEEHVEEDESVDAGTL